MPKHIIEFNMPEESEELRMTMSASKHYSILWDIVQLVRKWRKYDDREALPKDEVMSELNELLSEFEE